METLPSLTSVLACPPRPLGYRDIHDIRGVPSAVAAARDARAAGMSWSEVGAVFVSARNRSEYESVALRDAWSAYERACREDGTPLLPVTLRSMMALWFFRVVGLGRKSSALASYTSRVITRARLSGHEVPAQTVAAIWEELGKFTVAYPCQISPAAPPLGAFDGRLTDVLAFAAAQAHRNLFYCEMAALLSLAAAIYPRSSGLLGGHLRLRHILVQPPDGTFKGGVVVQLILPKKNKRSVDLRHDSHPIPMGPAALALLTFLRASGLLGPGRSPDAVVFPDLDPSTGSLLAPALSVSRSTYLLRRYIFLPSGVAGADRLTLRSIRYGSSTDAAAAGAQSTDVLARGGWRSQRGAGAYVDLTVATLLADNTSLSGPGDASPEGARAGRRGGVGAPGLCSPRPHYPVSLTYSFPPIQPTRVSVPLA